MSITIEEAQKESRTLAADILHIIEESIDLNSDVRERASLQPMILWIINSEYSNYKIEVNIKSKSENQFSKTKIPLVIMECACGQKYEMPENEFEDEDGHICSSCGKVLAEISREIIDDTSIELLDVDLKEEK